MEITRHFTATTFVVHQGKVLLHFHKKLGLWLPAGGHIERDELPEVAAVREVLEETGLTVQLYRPDPSYSFADSSQHLHRPQHLLLENINPFHQHIDFIYYAKTEAANLAQATGFQWFTPAELLQTTSPIPENVRILALEALTLLTR